MAHSHCPKHILFLPYLGHNVLWNFIFFFFLRFLIYILGDKHILI